MIDTRKVLTIFLASPNDMGREREHARTCADEWNATNSRRMGWTVDLLGWEDTLPGGGRPQALINPDVERCAVFIGMLHRWWGSPTGNGFSSGFEEEFDIASRRFDSTGSPRIALFFRKVADVSDPGDHLRRVLAFREQVFSSKKYLAKQIEDDDAQWANQFRQIFNSVVFTEIERLEGRGESSEPAGEPSDIHGGSDVATAPPGAMLYGDRLVALRQVAGLVEAEASEGVFSNATLSRLRLIGSAWRQSGMSVSYLGTHDINIIYNDEKTSALSRHELFGLIDAAVIHYSNQNAPLWRWVKIVDGDFTYLAILAIFSDDNDQQINSFQILADLGVGLGAHENELIRAYPTLKPAVKSAALRYVAASPRESFDELVKQELTSGDSSTRASALTAALSVLSMRSSAAALSFLIDEDVSLPYRFPLGPHLESIDLIEEAQLRKGLQHRDSALRRACVDELARRQRLTPDEIITARSDPSPEVRAASVRASLGSGVSISPDEAKTIIVRPSKNPLSMTRADGEEAFNGVIGDVLSKRSDEELRALREDIYGIAPAAYAEELSRDWRNKRAAAAHALKTGFVDHLDDVRDRYKDKYGASAEAFLPSPDLSQFIVGKLVRAALDVFARKGSSKDLGAFREGFRRADPVLTRADLRYFTRFGSWEDVQLVARARRTHLGASMLSEPSVPADEVAECILKMSKRRLPDLLAMDFASDLKASLLKKCARDTFRSLNTEIVFELFSEKEESLRRVAAIRAARDLSRATCSGLLERYLKLDYIYYNVTHWLDLSVSMPSEVTRRIADAHLSRS